MKPAHWWLTGGVVLATTVALLHEQSVEHPPTPAELAAEAARDSAARVSLDALCLLDYKTAKTLSDTIKVTKGLGPLFRGRDGACYIDSTGRARYRP